MVKIQDEPAKNLATLASQHFDNLNPKKLDGNYTAYALVTGIKNQRDADNNKGLSIRVAFWDYLLANNEQILREILTGTPSKLKTLRDAISNRFSSILFANQLSYSDSELTPFGNIVKNIFNYKNYRTKQYCVDYFKTFGLDYCPYCNMTEIYVTSMTPGMSEQDADTAFFELDHFYPQSRYPYLSLSFFNLIPACRNCNATLKREIDFDIDTHFNPFEKSFHDYFTFSIRNVIINKPSDIQIDINKTIPHPLNSITDFWLENRYNRPAVQHELFNAYVTIRNRSPKTIQSVARQFKNLFVDKEEVRKNLLGAQNVPMNDREINRNRYGKLKRDIYMAMGVI